MHLVLDPSSLLCTPSDVIFCRLQLKHNLIGLVKVSLEILPDNLSGSSFPRTLHHALIEEHIFNHLQVLPLVRLS